GAYEGQVAVELAVIEAVAEDVVVGDLKPHVSHRDVDQPAERAVEEGDHLEGCRPAVAKLAQDIVEGEAGVDDVLDQEHVPALDRVVDVADDADSILRLRPGKAVQVEVVDYERHVDLPRQVGEEEGDALQHADQDERLAAVVARD